MFFPLKETVEKDTRVVFIDLEKAYDQVLRLTIWRYERKMNILPKVFHTDTGYVPELQKKPKAKMYRAAGKDFLT